MTVSPQHRTKFAKLMRLITHARENEISVLVVDSPKVLGDTYDELCLNLSLIAEANLSVNFARP